MAAASDLVTLAVVKDWLQITGGGTDVTLARLGSWPIAGAAGALMSAVYNFGVASRFVWGRRHRPSARG